MTAAVKSQGGFDVPDAMVNGWLNDVHQQAVAAAEWQMSVLDVAATVAGRGAYQLPEQIVEVHGLYLRAPGSADAAPGRWERVSTTQMWDVMAGRTTLRGDGGVYAPNFGSARQRTLQLFPAPTEDSWTIVALASVVPALMVTDPADPAAAFPVIPADMHSYLEDGAIALGLYRIDERADLATSFQQRLNDMVAELRRRKNRQVSTERQRIGIWKVDFA